MSGTRGRRPPDGAIRQSQVLTTFGPGAMVDLPNHSVIISGLEHWKFPRGLRRTVDEPRLAGRVAQLLDLPRVELCAPPTDLDDPSSPFAGMPAFLFPSWFLAQVDESWTDPLTGKVYRTRPLVEWSQVIEWKPSKGGKWLDRDRRKVDVVPVRFVQACVSGHISDINWYAFVYEDLKAGRRGQLWLDEGGAGSDFAEIYVRCEATGARRRLAAAKAPGARALGYCNGMRPWLGGQSRERGCDEPARLLVRTASNAYFSQTLSVISIPDQEQELRDRVSEVWEEYLKTAEDIDELRYFRRKFERVRNALQGKSDASVWAEIEARRNPAPPPPKGIKQVEIETLLSSSESIGEDRPEGDFYARVRPLGPAQPWVDERVERLVLVHRLREVIAQVGFTRFEADEPDVDGVLRLGVARASLAQETTWVPALENRGEGVLIAFRPERIDAWMNQDGTRRRGDRLLEGLSTWYARRGLPRFEAPRTLLPYIMLHSLSHLLVTAVSLECGYSASSIKERIYAGPGGYGVLLYTGSAGSEGTLGGLVQVGERIEQHLRTAVELGRLCSNDPVCAYHEADDPREERFLHGAACHGCLLIAETSCERRNELLDRALVVPTVHTPDAAFFPSVGF